MSNIASSSTDVTTQQLISEMKQKLRETSSVETTWNHDMSIKMIDQQSDNSFHPCIVSIGITYSGNPPVNDFEPLKWVYMKSFLSRRYLNNSATDENRDEALEVCVLAIAALKANAKVYYGVQDIPNSLMQVLILDSCFILELLIRYYKFDESDPQRELPTLLFGDTEKHNLDPILRFSWILSAIRRDLTLVNNQIPFKFLHTVLSVTLNSSSSLPHNNFLEKMATVFFKTSHLELPCVPGNSLTGDHTVLLNLLVNIHRPTVVINGGTPPRRLTTARTSYLLNATSLAEVGVKFNNCYTSSLLDIKFSKGIFRIPKLHISKWTDSFFRNIIAFEALYPDREPYMASYLELISRLIVGTEDVRLLKRRGILINDLGTDEEIIDMLNNIRWQFGRPNYFYYQDLCNEVDSYYNRPRNTFGIQLKYWNLKNQSILTITSCTIIIMICIVIQAIYAGKTYRQRER